MDSKHYRKVLSRVANTGDSRIDTYNNDTSVLNPIEIKHKHSFASRFEQVGDDLYVKIVYCDTCGERSDGKYEDPKTKKIKG